MSPHRLTPQAVLQPIGSGAVPFTLERDGKFVIGRSSEADWVIADPTVSRAHARIEVSGEELVICDQGSRHGTQVNGRPLEAGERMPIRTGDVIAMGSWRCRVTSESSSTTLRTIADDGGSQIRAVSRDHLPGVARKRLDAIIDATRRLATATSVNQVSHELAASASAGVGKARTLVVRLGPDDECLVIAASPGSENLPISLSLLRAAENGPVVQLNGADPGRFGQSIGDLNIKTAICAPVLVGGLTECFLYLDSRVDEAALPEDAAAYCVALADLAGLAIERLRSSEMAERRRILEYDLNAARRSQELLLPPRTGAATGLEYAYSFTPGRHVAGDLFDVVEAGHGRTAFFLGDVSGKGAGAAVLMAAAQTHLRTLLITGAPLLDAVLSLNRYVYRHTDLNQFLTLFACVWDPASAIIELADAGHGYAVTAPPGHVPTLLRIEGSQPIGMQEQLDLEPISMPVSPGTRVILFSDGVPEQRDPGDAPFGCERVITGLNGSDSVVQDIERLTAALTAHAPGSFADDVTIASFRLEGIPSE